MNARPWWHTVLLVAIGVAAGTWVAGWLAVVVIAVAAALLDRSTWVGVRAAAGAALGWGVVLAVDAAQGPALAFARLMGQLLPVGAGGFVALTLFFAALLAWSAARLVHGIRPARP